MIIYRKLEKAGKDVNLVCFEVLLWNFSEGNPRNGFYNQRISRDSNCGRSEYHPSVLLGWYSERPQCVKIIEKLRHT
jgi:hypothetical protein